MLGDETINDFFTFFFFFLLLIRSDEDDPSGSKYSRMEDDSIQDKERFAR